MDEIGIASQMARRTLNIGIMVKLAVFDDSVLMVDCPAPQKPKGSLLLCPKDSYRFQVVAVGEEVRNLQVGDLVIVDFDHLRQFLIHGEKYYQCGEHSIKVCIKSE